ncbi:MAG: HAD-IA family hydrolase [Thermodesulfobacteriota bacterium]
MRIMKSIKAIAFDCDGVLFNTHKANTAFYNQILIHMGKERLTPVQFSYVHMHTVDDSLMFLFPDDMDRTNAHLFRKRMDYLPFIKDMEIEPNLKPVLSRIRKHYKTAIATNRSDTMGAVIREHRLDGLFDLIVSARDVPNPKPHPDPLIKVLHHFSIKPEEAIYVGDSEVDEQAAERAGVTLVAYRNPSLSTPYHIETLLELETLLEEQLSPKDSISSIR